MGLKQKKCIIAAALILCGANMYSCTLAVTPSTIPRFPDEKTSVPTPSENNTEYYAVICACSQYEDPKHNLPPPPLQPASETKLRTLYDTLIQTENWDSDHIILLLNKNATKHNITQALETMATTVDTNDIFLFTWNGHGGYLPDLDGDEAVWDPNDIYDEVICPYDTNTTNENLSNVITDDELQQYFSAINAKGKCLIFESCFSGGLIDQQQRQVMLNQTWFKKIIPHLFTMNSFQDVSSQHTMDVNGNNTIVIMSTLPNTTCRATFITHSPLLYSIATGIKNKKRYDDNNDGFLSAEELFKQARPKTLIQSSFYLIAYLGFMYLIFKYDLYLFFRFLPRLVKIYKFYDTMIPTPFVLATCLSSILYIGMQILIKHSKGHYLINWPNMHDDYPGELALIQL